ncbi:MAG: hypothetical protein QOE70_4260 [Chthoniobacter sp.]|jgi:thiol-disulfide isomerase/thioredoxin|nr:hypothetical protein [Chthoniobacter sp.]
MNRILFCVSVMLGLLLPCSGRAAVKEVLKVDAEEEESHPLAGAPAPVVVLDLLGGGKVELDQHHGKEIVILDFWATWCEPCVEELPIVAGVAEAFRDKGVVLYAVNEGEGLEGIRTFVERQKLHLNVALDPDGKVGRKYALEGLPQIVIIDKSGTIAVVHLGYGPATKQMLSRDLEAILAGKSPARKAAKEPELQGLELAWKHEGRWSGVATDGPRVVALAPTGRAAVLDARGQRAGEFKTERVSGFLRAANLAGDGAQEFVTFDAWGPQATAIDSAGAVLWRYPGGQGIDDVWPADLDGDGLDEVIIGYHGATGLHVLGPDGKLRWKDTSIGNVWHVCAGDVLGDSAVEVITTAADGKVHIFDAAGKPLKQFATELYANMVRVAAAPGGKAVILAGGTRYSDEHETLLALDGEGGKRWELEVGGAKDHIDTLLPAPGTNPRWLAAAMRGGRVLIIDAEKGTIIASSKGEARRSEVAWLAAEAGEPPLLVVTANDGLRAYRVPAK